MEPNIGVLVAYDTLTYREGLKAIITTDDIAIVAEAVVVQRVSLLAQRADVHVVVLGVSWHYDDEAGINVITEIRRRSPKKWVIAIGENQILVERARGAGANITFTIRVSKEELLDGIRCYAETYDYDAFVSYARQDAEWVQFWMLPRLEASGIRVCIDVRDFAPGAHRIAEIERAVGRSRTTLLVLTPEYLSSSEAEFEHILAQTADPAARKRRLIPLLLKPCAPFPRLSILTALDLTDPRRIDAQIARLMAAIKPYEEETDANDHSIASRRHTDRARGLEENPDDRAGH
jgi:hypothetical protein